MTKRTPKAKTKPKGRATRAAKMAKPPQADEDLFDQGEPDTNAGKPLDPREQRFVDHYFETGNATKAAKEAGYKGNERVLAVQGSRLLRRANVREALNDLHDEVARPTIMSAKERHELLTDIARGTARGLESCFGQLVESAPSFQARVKAAELLSKIAGELTEKRQVEGDVTIRVVRSNKAPSAIGTQEKDDA